jgi:hypothetical protein
MSGVVCPAGIVKLAGEIPTFEGSLLANKITTSDGAVEDSATANGADCPSPRVKLDGSVIDPKVMTVTVAVASTMFGRALAWMIVVPGA